MKKFKMSNVITIFISFVIAVSGFMLIRELASITPQDTADRQDMEKLTFQMTYKGVDKGLTCIGDLKDRTLSCDYVDFYNKYPHMKSNPAPQQ